MNDEIKEDLTELPGFPQEIAWAITAFTYLTDDSQWHQFWTWLHNTEALHEEADEEGTKEMVLWAASKLHSVGHMMADRRRAMEELPPVLRKMLGMEMPEDEEEIEDVRPGNYL